MGKLFRYRRPSLKTILGITRAKKQIKKDLGITAAMKPFRWWGNETRKIKRELGYYSLLGKLLRLGAPRFMGVPASPRPRTITKGSTLGVVVTIAVTAIAWGSIFGGCGVKSTQEPVAERSTPATVAPSDKQPVTVAYRPTPIATLADERIVEAPALHDLAEPPQQPTARDWADRTGKYHQAALLLDVIDGIVRLQKPDQKIARVPIEKLSDDDFAYLAAHGVKAPEPRTLTGRVVGVTDGDALIVLDEHNKQHKIRLASIDAPERNQASGQRAREALAAKIFQKDVRITWHEYDKYDQTIGDLYLDDRWINKEMVQEGWAWHYRKYSDSEELSDAEGEAQRNGLGLWSKSDAEPPWVFRHNEQTNPKPPPIVQTPAPKPAAKPAIVDNAPSSSDSGGDVQVRGYYRKDGTYVHPYTRHRPSR